MQPNGKATLTYLWSEQRFAQLELQGEGTPENIPGKEMVVRIIVGQRDMLGVGNMFGSIDQKIEIMLESPHVPMPWKGPGT